MKKEKKKTSQGPNRVPSHETYIRSVSTQPLPNLCNPVNILADMERVVQFCISCSFKLGETYLKHQEI